MLENNMIYFNVPPYAKKAYDYIQECVENQKICGDGLYTKKCNEWIEHKTGTAKCLLTTSGTHAIELAALLIPDIEPGDEVLSLPIYTGMTVEEQAYVIEKINAF